MAEGNTVKTPFEGAVIKESKTSTCGDGQGTGNGGSAPMKKGY